MCSFILAALHLENFLVVVRSFIKVRLTIKGLACFRRLRVAGRLIDINAVVVGDVLDGLGWELLGFGGDAHGGEDGTARGQIATECAR